MEPFSLTYNIFMIIHIVLVFVVIAVLRTKRKETARKVVLLIYFVLLAVLIIYKLLYPLDKEFMQDYATYWGPYTIFNELPLNPCNIVLLLIPFAILYNNRDLLSFCYYMGFLSPTLALVLPQIGYHGYSLFTLHMYGYYFCHFMGVAIPFFIYFLGIYKPCLKDVFRSSIVLTVIAFAVFGIDILLRITKVCPFSNYFYCMDPEGNPILELFYKWIPVPGLYLISTLLIYVPFSILFTIPSIIKSRKEVNI